MQKLEMRSLPVSVNHSHCSQKYFKFNHCLLFNAIH
uniref:Uncharacterized protein n=1 Tax=Arundo donax TaxID=35708 RepID=A0A0A9FL07_ARUDO